MLERKRQGKYSSVPGEDGDVELGEGSGSQETGIVREGQTLEQEVDNWDENAEDWEEDEANGSSKKKAAS